MKKSVMKYLVTGAAVACLGTMTVRAVPITGDISFSGGVTVDSPTLASATAITSYGSELVVTTIPAPNGSYAGLAGVKPTFTPFSWTAPALPIADLWSFTVSGVLYELTATSLSASFNSAFNIWNIGGTGMAYITGYDETPGTWNLSITQSGQSVAFSSSAAATPSVPDGGSMVMLLGLAMSGLGVAKRYLIV